jgi:hypothetical protein
MPSPSPLTQLFGQGHQICCISLWNDSGNGTMMETQWLLRDTVALGLVVGLHFLFFWPVECT